MLESLRASSKIQDFIATFLQPGDPPDHSVTPVLAGLDPECVVCVRQTGFSGDCSGACGRCFSHCFSLLTGL